MEAGARLLLGRHLQSGRLSGTGKRPQLRCSPAEMVMAELPRQGWRTLGVNCVETLVREREASLIACILRGPVS